MAVVLVVDDDRDMLALYGAILEDMGHQPVLHLAVDRKPETLIESAADAVIIDLETEQDRVAGLDVIESLRAHPATQKVPIILATAATEDVRPLRQRLETLDVAVLIKPFAIDKLRDVLGRVLPAMELPQEA